MKKTLIIGLLILANSVFGQIPGKRIEGPIVLFDTLTVKKGDILHLGKGSDPENGNFVHIYAPKDKTVNTLYNIFSNDSDLSHKPIPQRNLTKKNAGRQLVVESFGQIKSNKDDNRFVGIIDIWGNQVEVSYDPETNPLSTMPVTIESTIVIVDFEPAFRSGEIIKITSLESIVKAPLAELFLPFEMTREGIEPVVVDFNNVSRNELYNKAINWTNAYYTISNPATITSVPDDKITINAIAKNVKYSRILGNDFFGDLPYLFSVDLIDGEITMTFMLGDEDGDITDDSGEVIANTSPSHMFNKKGEVNKTGKIFKAEAERVMNDISYSIVDYLMK